MYLTQFQYLGFVGFKIQKQKPNYICLHLLPLSYLTWHLPAPLPTHSPLGVVWMTTYLLYHLKPDTNFFPMCSYIFCNISIIISHRDLHCFVFYVQKLPSMLFQGRKTSHVNLLPFSSQKAGVFFSMISLKGQDCTAPNLQDAHEALSLSYGRPSVTYGFLSSLITWQPKLHTVRSFTIYALLYIKGLKYGGHFFLL